jgi:undecaprenyl-diphosphatase
VSVTSEYIAYVFAAIGTMLAVRPRPWWVGLLGGLVLMAAGQGIRVGLAALVGRDRPPHADWEMHAAGYSFPSGHTATAVVVYGGTALLLAWAAPRIRRWVWPLFLVPLVVIPSRLYQGAHHPTDVLAGLLYSVAWVAVVSTVLLGAPTASSDGDARGRRRPRVASS